MKFELAKIRTSQKCKLLWTITLAVGHQSGSGLGLSLIIAILITDLDLSSQRALLAELGFGALIHSLGSDRQKCKPNWTITLSVGHQSSSKLGLSFIKALMITDLDLSSQRALFAKLGFGSLQIRLYN